MSSWNLAPRTPLLRDKVRSNLEARGAAGAAWLAGLPAVLERLEREWGIAIGRSFANATEAYVAEATLSDGAKAALKIPIPLVEKARREIAVLRAADGRGYVRLLQSDDASGAVLLERLGPQLAQLGLDIDAQIAAICTTLNASRIVTPGELRLMSGAEKAESLAGIIVSISARHPDFCSTQVRDVALRFARARRDAFDPARSVLGHGDAHAWNTLQDPVGGGFKFVDPEGLFIEPAHDLSISLREWPQDLLAGDTLARGRARCALLADLAGVDARAIWHWGLMETLANGLLYVDVGTPALGVPFIAVAEAWAAAEAA